MIAYAQEHVEAAKTMLGKLESAILFPLMTLMMGVALLLFIWGVVEYVLGASDQYGSARGEGRSHMMWGIIGFVVMLCAYTILRIAANTFGVTV